MRRRLLSLVGVCLIVLLAAPFAFADRGEHGRRGEHGDHGRMRIRGYITAFQLTGQASASNGGSNGSSSVVGSVYGPPSSVNGAIGSLTIATTTDGSVTASILGDTEVQAPASALASGFVGAAATVWVDQGNGGLVVTRVEINRHSEDEENTTLKGTIVDVNASQITLDTEQGTVTLALDPSVVVFQGDHSRTLQDLSPGMRVKVRLTFSGTSFTVVEVKILDEHHGDHQGNHDSSSQDQGD